MTSINTLNNPYLAILTIFVLACFVGYYVVWKVTPALHTPLMSVTNAISSIIIIGALLATGSPLVGELTYLGGFGIFIAAINIFGGFVITQRMLSMYKKSR
jgi:NAD(P) transhydrogenase subunit alpha